MIYDIIIIGNGILGTTLAWELSRQQKNIKIAVVGPKNKFGSGSKASGAMINVFAEIESDFMSNIFLKKKFEIAVRALDMWKDHHLKIQK